MKKASSARRIPRKIGSDDDEPTNVDAADDTTASTLIRPSTKPRKPAASRRAFRPGNSEDEESPAGGIVKPKRSKLSNIAIQRNASQRSSLLSAALPRRELEESDDGPSYSAAALQQLKDSTPATPHDLTTDASNSEIDDVANETKELDISSKFGTNLSAYARPAAIPSATEIAEKKARRARLAKEQAAEEYVSLDPSDPELDNDDDDNVMRNEQGRLILKPKDKYAKEESRLVRDDEDVMENFEEFTEADAKMVFGRKANIEAAKKRKAEMAAQIAEAEGVSDSDSNASERERNEAFEAAQTKHGTYGSHATSDDPYADIRPKTPPIISPLPTLDGAIGRLRKQVADMQTSRMSKLQEMEALQREKIRLGEEEVRIQRALKETAQKFEDLRKEKGIEKEGVAIDLAGLSGTSMPAQIEPPPGTDDDGDVNGDAPPFEGGRGGLGSGVGGRIMEDWAEPAVHDPYDDEVEMAES